MLRGGGVHEHQEAAGFGGRGLHVGVQVPRRVHRAVQLLRRRLVALERPQRLQQRRLFIRQLAQRPPQPLPSLRPQSSDFSRLPLSFVSIEARFC